MGSVKASGGAAKAIAPLAAHATLEMAAKCKTWLAVSTRASESYALGAARQSSVPPVRMITEPTSVHWSGIAPNTERSISAA